MLASQRFRFASQAAEGGGGSYTQNVVDNNVDGVLSAANSLSLGAGDHNEFTLSMWARYHSATDNGYIFSLGVDTSSAGRRIKLGCTDITSSANVRLQLGRTSTTSILDDQSTETIDKTAFNHYLVSRSGTTLYVYVNDTALTFDAPTNTNQTFPTLDSLSLMATTATVSEVDGEVADVWFESGQYFDLSIEANRRKFIDAGGFPVDLGSTGQNPTGSTPDIFIGGPHVASDWNLGTNLGTAGNLTHSGSNFTDV
jgi:hypothetical protein